MLVKVNKKAYEKYTCVQEASSSAKSSYQNFGVSCMNAFLSISLVKGHLHS